MSTGNNIYTTRQAASIGLQPGNLIGETTYITESQITPPIKQRIRNRKLLSTNISRCQCCCPPYASGLCRSCLCPCWAYLLIGLIFALLLAALGVELGFLTREKTYTQTVTCTNTFNTSFFVNETTNMTYSSSTARSSNCVTSGSGLAINTSMWSSFIYLILLIKLFVSMLKR